MKRTSDEGRSHDEEEEGAVDLERDRLRGQPAAHAQHLDRGRRRRFGAFLVGLHEGLVHDISNDEPVLAVGGARDTREIGPYGVERVGHAERDIEAWPSS